MQDNLIFKVNLGFNSKKLKFDGQLGTWLEKFKTNDQTEKSVIVWAENDQIIGKIEENLKFGGQLRVQLHKLESKDQDEHDAKLGADDWVWQGWNFIKLKVWEAIMVQLKAIERIGTKIKYVIFQIKNPNF